VTYCVGLRLNRGLVFMSDTRTNAGVDNISVFRKMFTWTVPGERVITLMGNNEGRSVGEILADVSTALAGVHLPNNYSVYYAGDDENTKESMAFLRRAFLLAVAGVMVILVIQFNSILLPLIIVVSIALSIIGVMWGLLLTGTRASVIMTGLGVISLAGIVVNNAIVLIDCINLQRKAGMGALEAVVTAGRLRLRPVLLTAATTILGLIPMAIGWSIDVHSFPFKVSPGGGTSAWWAPMAVAVIGPTPGMVAKRWLAGLFRCQDLRVASRLAIRACSASSCRISVSSTSRAIAGTRSSGMPLTNSTRTPMFRMPWLTTIPSSPKWPRIALVSIVR